MIGPHIQRYADSPGFLIATIPVKQGLASYLRQPVSQCQTLIRCGAGFQTGSIDSINGPLKEKIAAASLTIAFRRVTLGWICWPVTYTAPTLGSSVTTRQTGEWMMLRIAKANIFLGV